MEFSFDEALLYCLNQQDPESGYWNGHYYGLVSVGQLRHFRNRYDFGPSVDRHQHYFDEQRMFRYVNIQKMPKLIVFQDLRNGSCSLICRCTQREPSRYRPICPLFSCDHSGNMNLSVLLGSTVAKIIKAFGGNTLQAIQCLSTITLGSIKSPDMSEIRSSGILKQIDCTPQMFKKSSMLYVQRDRKVGLKFVETKAHLKCFCSHLLLLFSNSISNRLYFYCRLPKMS